MNKNGREGRKTVSISRIRKKYMFRLGVRFVVLAVCIYLALFDTSGFFVLEGMNFFNGLSVYHLLWFLWMFDMFLQLVPVKDKIALGSQKLFKQHFKPIREKINYTALKEYVVSTTKAAYKIFIIWAVVILFVGSLYFGRIIGNIGLFMFSVVFYVCDLICVLVWCPFRLILKNKCCTTCRIFNWDHLMMFSPMIFIKGFYSLSLVFMAFIVWLVWELCVCIYPERFWEYSNAALKCSECTDKLCTQYCGKK